MMLNLTLMQQLCCSLLQSRRRLMKEKKEDRMMMKTLKTQQQEHLLLPESASCTRPCVLPNAPSDTEQTTPKQNNRSINYHVAEITHSVVPRSSSRTPHCIGHSAVHCRLAAAAVLLNCR